jgi:23S rRNA (cytosine1962-C5)-methyltransferase
VTPQALLDAIATMTLPLDAQRLFHGRGGLYPGCEPWALDWYPPVLLLTSYQPVSDDELAPIQAALAARWAELMPDQPLNLVFQHRDEVPRRHPLMAVRVPDPHVVTEEGARSRCMCCAARTTACFWTWAKAAAGCASTWRRRPAPRQGYKVLNLFAYTCAFSVVALQAVPARWSMWTWPRGHATGQQNHRLNGITAA